MAHDMGPRGEGPLEKRDPVSEAARAAGKGKPPVVGGVPSPQDTAVTFFMKRKE